MTRDNCTEMVCGCRQLYGDGLWLQTTLQRWSVNADNWSVMAYDFRQMVIDGL